MERADLIKKMTKEGYFSLRYVDGRGLCGLRDFAFTVGLCYGLDENSYLGRYCYPKHLSNDASIALSVWSGKEDPIGGWVKHKGIGGEWSNPNHIT